MTWYKGKVLLEASHLSVHRREDKSESWPWDTWWSLLFFSVSSLGHFKHSRAPTAVNQRPAWNLCTNSLMFSHPPVSLAPSPEFCCPVQTEGARVCIVTVYRAAQTHGIRMSIAVGEYQQEQRSQGMGGGALSASPSQRYFMRKGVTLALRSPGHLRVTLFASLIPPVMNTKPRKKVWCQRSKPLLSSWMYLLPANIPADLKGLPKTKEAE